VKRRSLSTNEKARVIDRQRNRCACGCGERLVVGQIDFDHRLALQFGGTNDIENFDALIRKHHRAKSDRENTDRAKADRLRAKANGTWLNAKDRELAKIQSRTKQLAP
jgi:5-methylcytosine-specific restriction endonuclease McrA